MDPLSFTASAIAVIQAAAKATNTLRSVHRASSEVRDLVNELQELQRILKVFTQDLPAEYLSQLDRQAQFGIFQILKESTAIIEQLDKEIKLFESTPTPVRQFKWEFRRKQTRELLDQLKRNKRRLDDLMRLSVSRSAKDIILDQLVIRDQVDWQHNIIRWLKAPDISPIHSRARARQTSGTGKWFLESDKYNTWKSTPNSLLCLWGDPGSGKTILFSSVVEDIVQLCASWRESSAPFGCAYHYASTPDPDTIDLRSLVSSITTQLLADSRKCDKLKALYSESSSVRSGPEIEKLLGPLGEILDGFQEVYILIDGLDEIRDLQTDPAEFLQLLRLLENPNTHVLLTSRSNLETRAILETDGSVHVDISEDLIQDDIRAFVNEQLQGRKWAFLDQDTKQDVRERLVQQSNGMFRWVGLQMDQLRKARTRRQLVETFSSLPRGLYDVYEHQLLRINPGAMTEARTLFHWLVHAFRPLRLEEAAETLAIGLDPDAGSLEDNRLFDITDVLHIASDLVKLGRVDNDHELVTFVHSSAKEFLLSSAILNGPVASFHVSDTSCEVVLRGCLHYLRAFRAAGSVTAASFKEYPLAEYAAQFWIRHAYGIDGKPVCDLSDVKGLIMDLLSDQTAFENWIRLFDPNDPSKRFPYLEDLDDIPQPLYYMALAGLEQPVAWLLDVGEGSVNDVGGRYGTALEAAAAGGHINIVKTLVSRGADIVQTCGDYGTPLQAAAAAGNLEIVQFLVENGAVTNSPQGLIEGMYGSPLEAAALRGDEKIVELLMNFDANPNVQGGHYGSALQAAASRGYGTILERLARGGADINAQGGFYGSPLLAAVIEGHTNAVRFLLDQGADPSVGRFSKRPLLHESSAQGNEQIVALLLSMKGSDVKAVDENERTALHEAAANGHPAVLDCLLVHEADIEAHDKDGMTPLHLAAYFGHPRAAWTLLQHKADINALDLQLSTPLHLAIQKHHGHVHRLLIDSGAKLNLADKSKKTPAQHAFKMTIRRSKYRRDRKRTRKLTKGRQADKVEVLRRKTDHESQKEKHRFLLRKTFSLKGKAGESARQQLLREYDVLQRLHHPHIVQFLGYKERKKKNKAYIYLEYCTEGDLDQYIKQQPLAEPDSANTENSETDSSTSSSSSDSDDTEDSENENTVSAPADTASLSCLDIWSMVLQLGSALMYCHHGVQEEGNRSIAVRASSQTILHRDLKPANIVITKDHRNLLVAKLCDLGLAKVVDDHLTRGIGTTKYMPPEVKFDQQPWTRKGDIFSLGATLKDLNLRRVSSNLELKTKNSPLLRQCEAALQTTLDECIDEEPSNRPSSLILVQRARENLILVPDEGRWALENCRPTEDHAFPLTAVLQFLETIFYSLSEGEIAHAQVMLPRFHEVWEDIGPKEGSSILWSDNESSFLRVLLQHREMNKDWAPISLLWEPRSKPIEGEECHSDCRWDTRGLSAPDITRLIAKGLGFRLLALEERGKWLSKRSTQSDPIVAEIEETIEKETLGRRPTVHFA